MDEGSNQRSHSPREPSESLPLPPGRAPRTLGLDPYLREQPAPDELRPSGGLLAFAGLRPVERRPEDHPTDADAASTTEELATPD
jgi:hypothetical protein